MRCAIWYHWYNLKNVKKTHGGLLLLVNLQALVKVTLLHWCFSRFLNCLNCYKLRKASQMSLAHNFSALPSDWAYTTSLCYRFYFGRYTSELIELAAFL